MRRKCLHVSTTDLLSVPNAVTELVQGVGERVERRTARFPGQMGAAQQIADPLEWIAADGVSQYFSEIPGFSDFLWTSVEVLGLGVGAPGRS
jgi:hypothetical protein